MKDRSMTHDQAFSDLSMVEKTVLEVLENLHAEAETEEGREAINRVEELILE